MEDTEQIISKSTANDCPVLVAEPEQEQEPAKEQISCSPEPTRDIDCDNTARKSIKDGVESPSLSAPIPEVVLDEATGLLRRALLAVTKEKELEAGKSVLSSYKEGETLQIRSPSSSVITMAIAGAEFDEKEIDEGVQSDAGSIMMNIKGMPIVELLHKDQLDGFNSLADTHIVCEDGHVPFHRYILMAASNLMNELLINEDPSELAVIHIPDVKVANVVQVLCILYSGKALYSKCDEKDIYKIFRMLGISTNSLQFRNSKAEDSNSLGKLRFYEKELECDEEEFIQNMEEEEVLDVSNPPSVDNALTEATTEEIAQEDIEAEETHRGPKVSSRSQIDKAETAKFLSIKMEIQNQEDHDDDSIVETDFKIKCRYCHDVFTSEESLSNHLSNFCGSHLVGQYSYNNKQCLGCRRKFPQFSLYGLINHVESCPRLQVAFSATASQFVNGTLPPIIVKEEGGLNVDELNEDGDMPPGFKIQKATDGSKIRKKKAKKGVKKRKNPLKGKNTATVVSPPAASAAASISTSSNFTIPKSTSTSTSASSTTSNSTASSGATEIVKTAKSPTPSIVTLLSAPPPTIQVVDASSLVDASPPSDDGERSCPEVILIDDDDSDYYEDPVKKEQNGFNGGIFPPEDDCEYVIENNESFKDIASVPMKDLRLLLTTCPVCKKRYNKLKIASKCLRAHGLRRCWICLKLISANGQSFHQHNQKYHIIPETDGKVECSFCKKQFGYNIGINTHMGNYHFSRLLETTTTDFEQTCDNEEPLTPSQVKTLEALNRGVGSNISDVSSGVQNVLDGDPEVMEIDGSSDIEEISPPPPITINNPVRQSSSSPAVNKQPNLGRVLLEIKEINGVIYNVYGLINPSSTDPKTKFSKVIAIRNTDVESRLQSQP